MTDSGGSTRCQICKNYGCTASNHNRCSLCLTRGHSKRTCGLLQEEGEANYDQIVRNFTLKSETIGLPLRRESTKRLCQEEVDMAARVLIGCQLENSTGHQKECILDRACRLTGVGQGKMTEIKKALESDERPMAVEPRRGKWSRTQPRLLLPKITKCIDALHHSGIMTSVPKIAASLDFHEGIKLCETTLGRVLRKMGYIYRQPGPDNIMLARESKEMRDYRLTYLRAIQSARKQREVVYLDESYINSRHQAQRCWVLPDSKVYIPSGKGSRYILYAAGSRNGWVGEPVVFPYRDTGDYHSAMNAAHFEELFTSTCKTAEELLGPCVLVMDNAAYHRKLTSEKDRLGYWQKLPKKEVLKAWADGEVPGQEKYDGPPVRYKKQVIDWLKENRPEGVCKVKTIADEYGHTVLFLPPYRPELNAIETAWGVSKNYVARKNSPMVNFSSLLSVVQDGLKQVTIDTWVKLDQKVRQEEERQRAGLEKEAERLEEFRRLHPDLVFTVDNTDSDEEDEMDAELLEEIGEGLEGRDAEADCPHGGVLPSEREALDGLLLLSEERIPPEDAVTDTNHDEVVGLDARLSLSEVGIRKDAEE